MHPTQANPLIAMSGFGEFLRPVGYQPARRDPTQTFMLFDHTAAFK